MQKSVKIEDLVFFRKWHRLIKWEIKISISRTTTCHLYCANTIELQSIENTPVQSVTFSKPRCEYPLQLSHPVCEHHFHVWVSYNIEKKNKLKNKETEKRLTKDERTLNLMKNENTLISKHKGERSDGTEQWFYLFSLKGNF